MADNNSTPFLASDESLATPSARATYHAPQLTEHGELAVLTKGIGGSGADGGGYVSFPP